jgi:hypothetical protein
MEASIKKKKDRIILRNIINYTRTGHVDNRAKKLNKSL